MGKKGKEKKVNFEWEKAKRDGFAAVSFHGIFSKILSIKWDSK